MARETKAEREVLYAKATRTDQARDAVRNLVDRIAHSHIAYPTEMPDIYWSEDGLSPSKIAQASIGHTEEGDSLRMRFGLQKNPRGWNAFWSKFVFYGPTLEEGEEHFTTLEAANRYILTAFNKAKSTAVPSGSYEPGTGDYAGTRSPASRSAATAPCRTARGRFKKCATARKGGR